MNLFFISGIEERALKPIKTKEVKEIAWIPITEYIQETIKQNTLEHILCQPVSKYCTYYVKSFAYYVSEWQTKSLNKMINADDPYERISMHDDILNSCPESLKCISTLCLVKEYAILYKELPFFMHGFFYHFIV